MTEWIAVTGGNIAKDVTGRISIDDLKEVAMVGDWRSENRRVRGRTKCGGLDVMRR